MVCGFIHDWRHPANSKKKNPVDRENIQSITAATQISRSLISFRCRSTVIFSETFSLIWVDFELCLLLHVAVCQTVAVRAGRWKKEGRQPEKVMGRIVEKKHTHWESARNFTLLNHHLKKMTVWVMIGILVPFFPSLKSKMSWCSQLARCRSSASDFIQRPNKKVSSKDGREAPNGHAAAQRRTRDN